MKYKICMAKEWTVLWYEKSTCTGGKHTSSHILCPSLLIIKCRTVGVAIALFAVTFFGLWWINFFGGPVFCISLKLLYIILMYILNRKCYSCIFWHRFMWWLYFGALFCFEHSWLLALNFTIWPSFLWPEKYLVNLLCDGVSVLYNEYPRQAFGIHLVLVTCCKYVCLGSLSGSELT